MENKIVSSEDLSRLEKMTSFRNLLVHYYERVDDQVVYSFFKNDLSDIDLFVNRFVESLKNA